MLVVSVVAVVVRRVVEVIDTELVLLVSLDD